MRERISKILESWFIQEPALFQVLCTHDIVENRNMKCPVRCGNRRVEFNPDFLKEMSDECVGMALGAEAIRLLLKHPYERRPDNCCNQAVAVGSNLVIGDNYHSSSFLIDVPADYELAEGMPYEWYSRKIQAMLPTGDGNEGDNREYDSLIQRNLSQNAENNRDLAELWGEDDLAVAMINGVIEGCQDWGSLGGKFAEQIKASTKAKIDWRAMFNGFCSSIISRKRRLTRMRPNRRYGFEMPGEKTEFDTRLLVAVDVSGSISSENLSYFYGVINSAFKYGFQAIDVIQFDCGVRAVQSLKNAVRETLAIGRGGTSFQEPIEYADKNKYDGLVILTDGYAPEPLIPENMRCKIIWVCQDEECYSRNHGWMEKYGRVCTINLK